MVPRSEGSTTLQGVPVGFLLAPPGLRACGPL